MKDTPLPFTVLAIIAVGLPDRPGGFAETIKVLSDRGISVEYMYAFISRDSDRAYLIMRVPDNDEAVAVLSASGCEILDENSVYKL